MEENWSEQTVKNALRANASKSGHCIVQDGVKCLNPWDCQSKRIFETDGKYPTLAAYSSRWGMGDGVCYPNVARTLTAEHDGSWCPDKGPNVVAIDCRNLVCNEELSATLAAKPNGGQSLNYINPICYRKTTKPRDAQDDERWQADSVTNTLNTFEYSDVRTSEVVVSSFRNGGYGDMVEGVGTLRANGGDAGGGYGEHHH